jgi:hypothetical protein
MAEWLGFPNSIPSTVLTNAHMTHLAKVRQLALAAITSAQRHRWICTDGSRRGPDWSDQGRLLRSHRE